MFCGAKEAGGVYRPRHPQESPFYQLVERFYPESEAVYEERYQERYGFWRPIIGTVVRKFLECGDLKHGFARVRCPKCGEELFVPFSCRGRCFCPSCHEKRALEKAGWVAEHVCAEVPHRQFVFTIPKRLRIYFRFERRLLGELCRAAARTVITVYRAARGRPDAVPGVVGAIQTFGQLIHWHPHIHALVTEGVFLPDGTFLPLPKLATEPFLKLWEQEVFALLLAEGKITEEVVANIRSWKHSGFSVDQSVRLEAGDQEGVQRLIQFLSSLGQTPTGFRWNGGIGAVPRISRLRRSGAGQLHEAAEGEGEDEVRLSLRRDGVTGRAEGADSLPVEGRGNGQVRRRAAGFRCVRHVGQRRDEHEEFSGLGRRRAGHAGDCVHRCRRLDGVGRGNPG